MDFGLLIQDAGILAVVIIAVPAVLAAYIIGTEFLVTRLPDRNRGQVRPWIWVGPALVFVTAFLVLPALGTFVQSVENHAGNYVGMRNYVNQLGDFSGGAWIAIRNNILWLVLYTLVVLFFGILLAVIFDPAPFEGVGQLLVFLPLAISSVAPRVI